MFGLVLSFLAKSHLVKHLHKFVTQQQPMTGEQLKALEGRLWKAADELRANSKLTATEYSMCYTF